MYVYVAHKLHNQPTHWVMACRSAVKVILETIFSYIPSPGLGSLPARIVVALFACFNFLWTSSEDPLGPNTLFFDPLVYDSFWGPPFFSTSRIWERFWTTFADTLTNRQTV